MRTIRDIMAPDVLWLPDDMPLKRAAEALTEQQVGGAPVCSPDGKIIGMLSKTDLTGYYGCANDLRLVREVMTPGIVSAHPNEPIQRAIELMAFERVHRLLVLDDERLVGIVTPMDVIRELAGFPRRERTTPGHRAAT